MVDLSKAVFNGGQREGLLPKGGKFYGALREWWIFLNRVAKQILILVAAGGLRLVLRKVWDRPVKYKLSTGGNLA